MKTITLDEIEDKYIGKKGTSERDAYDREVELFVICETIKQARESKSPAEGCRFVNTFHCS